MSISELDLVRPVGIETEYGLNCDGFTAEVDFAFEASTIVRAAALGAFVSRLGLHE